ncbi:hypothetical protein BOO86_08545 [Mycobacterium sp. CBMA 234]|nr:hypothetical protein [Mycolicibacterium sp. CBMA 234]
MVKWAQEAGVQRVSLAFAPFPRLFSKNAQHGVLLHTLRVLAHLPDRFINLESLYRYLRKYSIRHGQWHSDT